MSELQPGDIVQLDPHTTHNPLFAGRLLVVTEVKPWGVQGYVHNAGTDGAAYYRAETGTFEPTGGRAPWVLE